MSAKKKRSPGEVEFFLSVFIFCFPFLSLALSLLPSISRPRSREMEEDSDGPDVVSIERRDNIEAAGAAGAGGTAHASRGGASAGITDDGQSSLPLCCSLGEQHQQHQHLEQPLLTKNQKHKLRQKRCRLAKRLTMQVRREERKKVERRPRRRRRKCRTN